MFDIDWLENPRGEVQAGVARAALIRIGSGRRIAQKSGRRAQTVTLTFACEASPIRLRKTFTRSFRPGSRLLRFLRGMTGCSQYELENPFQSNRLLLAQLQKVFALVCVERGVFVDIASAAPAAGPAAGGARGQAGCAPREPLRLRARGAGMAASERRIGRRAWT